MPVHDIPQIVLSQSDAVIGQAILRKIVGPNFFAAISAANLAATIFSDGLLLLLKRQVVQSGAQDSKRLRAILDLRFLVLARRHTAGGKGGGTPRKGLRVHRLAARARRTESVDAYLLRIDADLDVVRFR